MEDFHRKVLTFQNRTKDWTDDPAAGVSKSLMQEIQKLEDEAQLNKNPMTVKNRVKSVMNYLRQAGKSDAMSWHHADELIDQCEDFVRTLDKM